MLNKYAALKKYFGYSSFRSGQEKITDTILSGRDILAVLPTGAGKSLCFQLPAVMSEGTAVVISPLISLMKDQVYALRENGISAATINSSLSEEEYREVCRNLLLGEYKLIYVSPERLHTSAFGSAVHSIDISMICVDEAHCVSVWGQDFRSSYLEISDFINSFEKRPVVAAFTATATGIVRDDICRLLSLKNPEITVSGFDRKNLFFSVEEPNDKFSALRKHLDRHKGKSCIVYCSTRKTVDEVCEKLISCGYNATRYHAGLLTDERKYNQELFIKDKVKIIAATNAFGMGIDKADVSLVVHYNMPGDLESYYQEAGRAGRDGSGANCVLFYSPDDISVQEHFINNPADNVHMNEKEKEAFGKRKLKMLGEMENYCVSKTCLRNRILEYFGESTNGECNNCSVCLKGEKHTESYSLKEEKIFDKALFEKLKALRKRISHEKKIPEFCIFSDSILRIMSTDKPDSIEKMKTLKGVSERKAEKYASVFLKEIEKYNLF